MDEARPMNDRLGRDEYYLGIAIAVAGRAECRGMKVGAVIVVRDRVVSTGYNGTPEGMKNCSDGGCVRCAMRDSFGSGAGYDKCICVHAEANSLLTAARFGISVDGETAYVTHQPCFSCSKELLQAGISRLVYVVGLPAQDPNPTLEADLRNQQQLLMDRLNAMCVAPSTVLEGLRYSINRVRHSSWDVGAEI